MVLCSRRIVLNAAQAASHQVTNIFRFYGKLKSLASMIAAAQSLEVRLAVNMLL
jgi:hypothetical protein